MFHGVAVTGVIFNRCTRRGFGIARPDGVYADTLCRTHRVSACAEPEYTVWDSIYPATASDLPTR
jgi:hypothetical protein